jgi:hypothetical protein
MSKITKLFQWAAVLIMSYGGSEVKNGVCSNVSRGCISKRGIIV